MRALKRLRASQKALISLQDSVTMTTLNSLFHHLESLACLISLLNLSVWVLRTFMPGEDPESENDDSVMASLTRPFLTFSRRMLRSFSPDSHPSFSVSPNVGRMDRRGGEISHFQVQCDPRGASGELKGTLVIILTEENEKLCYGITAAAR